jgi:cobalt transporter subunit CbtB
VPEQRAPLAVPAFVAGVIALVLAILLGPALVLAAGLSAALMGGQAWHDTRLHGYTGEHLAVGGAVLGLGAIVISMITWL